MKRKITTRGLLKYLNAQIELVFPLNRQKVYRRAHGTSWLDLDLEEYFPSVVKHAAHQLHRKGFVEQFQTPDGLIFRISEKGRSELLKLNFNEFHPKTGKWDGKWRMVFFDIAELRKSRRDKLRKYLLALGMKRFQDSVFISPYDVSSEIKYLREYLEIPHGVKLAEISWVENSDELKEIFNL